MTLIKPLILANFFFYSFDMREAGGPSLLGRALGGAKYRGLFGGNQGHGQQQVGQQQVGQQQRIRRGATQWSDGKQVGSKGAQD